jgi:hypothetical protein
MPKRKAIQYPRFRPPGGDPVYCIAWAIDTFRSGWEWFATDIVDKTSDDVTYYGYVMGQFNEYGTFRKRELEELGITVYTNPESLRGISPPTGWKRLPDLEE